MRTGWVTGRDYPVICHTVWDLHTRRESFNARALKRQPDYMAAKKSADFVAAQTIVDSILGPEGLQKVHAKLRMERFEQDPLARKPVVVAPVSATSKNLLPVLAAHNIAYQLQLGVDRDIVQLPKQGRTGTSAMSRLLNQAEFAGPVTPGREYIIVDDNYTTGGTIAALRSYIEANKGKVVCTTVLADQNRSTDVYKKIRPHEIRLDITDETRNQIKERHGWRFENHFGREIGFDAGALTDREGRFVGSFSNERAFFKAVEEERGRASARSGSDFPAAKPA